MPAPNPIFGFSKTTGNMKNFLFAFSLLLSCDTLSFAQDQDSVIWVYAQIVGGRGAALSDFTVGLDFGRSSKLLLDEKIIDPKTQKPKIFDSMVDALNLMVPLGWDFVQAYSATVYDQSISYWLIRRAVRVDESGQYIPLSREAYRKMQHAGN